MTREDSSIRHNESQATAWRHPLRDGQLDDHFIGDRRIFRRGDLSAAGKLVYLCLCNHTTKGASTAMVSYETMARECEIRRRTAISAVAKLCETGIVTKEATQEGKRVNRYKVWRAG